MASKELVQFKLNVEDYELLRKLGDTHDLTANTQAEHMVRRVLHTLRGLINDKAD